MLDDVVAALSALHGVVAVAQISSNGTMAEWLTREIRNLFLSEGAGSNPAGVDHFCLVPLLASFARQPDCSRANN